jgi:hypothetical protein
LLPYHEKHWLVYETDYTVSQLQQQDIGGTLTLLIELPPEAEQLVIRRVTPKTQETDLHNGARLPAQLIEGIGDKATMEIQELAEQMLTKDDEQEIRQALNDALETEKDERVAADLQLQANITEEAALRENRDEQLQLAINNEAQERHNQDALLQQHITNEAAARIQADQSLHNEVVAEEAARRQADEILDIKKQDRLPDEIHPLIDSTGKINPVYIPDTILGAVKYGGTFNGQGTINASGLAPELQGVIIDNINTANYLGFYFIANNTYTFSDGTIDITYETGDKAICQGNHTPKWAKVDNTDDVSSVNGKKGAVVLTKGDIGLENVLNIEQVPASEKAQPNGIPTLDEEGKIPFAQIPEIALQGFGVFKFYIPQSGPKAKHLILRYPAGIEPPNMYIDRDPDSQTRGHLIWDTGEAGELDLGDVATPLVDIEAKIGDLTQLETEEKGNLVGAINKVNETAGVVQTVDAIAPEDQNVQLRHTLTRAGFEALKAEHSGKAPAGRYIITDEGIDEEAQ